MKTKSPVFDLSMFYSFILPVLVFVFGLQLIRGFVASVTWYLMFTVGVGSLDLIPYAFGTFFLGFLAAPLRRLAGNRGSLWITAGGVAVLRLVEQISRDPGLDLWLTMAGIGLFLNFISLFINWTRDSDPDASKRWTYGLILGFGLDAALSGVFGLRELSTVPGIIPLVIIALLAVGVIWAIFKEPQPSTGSTDGSKGKFSAGLMAVGMLLVLQLIYFQSSGWVEEVSKISFPLGFILVMAGYLAAASGLELGYARPRSLNPILAAIAGSALTIATFSVFPLAGFTLIALLLSQFYLGWGLAGIGLNSEKKSSTRFWITTLAVNGGMVLFLTLVFTYYLGLDFALPFPREIIPAIAAGILVILITISSFQKRTRPDQARDYSGLLTAGAIVLIPVACWIVWSPGPKPVEGDGFPVKVMTYNIHSGYHMDGYQDLEGIARVIEESGADIIGMQEVSRGRLIDNSADMPSWLSRRLKMPYIFKAAEEKTWGNAILSSYPIIDSGTVQLPREGAPIGRGLIWAKIDIGADEPLLVIVTHLHQVEADTHIRAAQIPVILDFWDHQEQTVIMGDFNAEPSAGEIGLIYDSGLLDAWLEAGQGQGYTFDANDPYQRIDYIWVSPDLGVIEIKVVQTLASDHIPVLTTISYGK